MNKDATLSRAIDDAFGVNESEEVIALKRDRASNAARTALLKAAVAVMDAATGLDSDTFGMNGGLDRLIEASDLLDDAQADYRRALGLTRRLEREKPAGGGGL